MDRAALARYGLNVADVRTWSIRRRAVQRYPRWSKGSGASRSSCGLPATYRDDLQAMGNLLLESPAAASRSALNQVAQLSIERGPEVVSRENAQRRIVVQANVRGRDLGSFVEEAQQNDWPRLIAACRLRHRSGAVSSRISSERGSGFMIVLPMSLVIIFGLLFAAFGSCVASHADSSERAVRAGRRNRGAVAARSEPQPLGLDRFHRAVRRGGAERRRDGQLHQPAPGRMGLPMEEAVLDGAARGCGRC